ncbi:hypothetical protein BIW11_09221, partial [Tropilaelaps mercedesae]
MAATWTISSKSRTVGCPMAYAFGTSHCLPSHTGQWSASYFLVFESMTLFVCSILHKIVSMARQLQRRLRSEGFSRVEDISEMKLPRQSVVGPKPSEKQS